MLDWVTGDPNAKYFVTQLLASTVGAAVDKAIFPYTASTAGAADASSALYALPFKFVSDWSEAKGVLLINKKASTYNVTLNGLAAGASATVVEVNDGYAGGAGFQPPLKRSLSAGGEIELGPFAVAVLIE